MQRVQRLKQLVQTLSDGNLHTARSLSDRFAVSLRTIYRDMDTLQASGVPVSGTPGTGYRATGQLTLPPLSVTEEELSALMLGLAVIEEAADTILKDAANSLAGKIDRLLPTRALADADLWQFETYPFADIARGLGHMQTLRSALDARQKLQITYRRADNVLTHRNVRPLELGHWGRIWRLTAWCELRSDFRVFRLDLMESAEALPELFSDEPGKRLADYLLSNRTVS